MRSVGAVDDGPSAQRAVHKGPQGLRASVYCSYVLYVAGIGPKVTTDGDDPAARLIWSAGYCSTSTIAFQHTRAERGRAKKTNIRISIRSLLEYGVSTFILYKLY